MSEERTIILTPNQVEQKIRRIAYQLLENNYKEEQIILIGIERKGKLFAQRIYQYLSKIADYNVKFETISIDKSNDVLNTSFSSEIHSIEGQSVVLIDDVLNSGKTLIYAAAHLLDANLKKLSTVALVDRRHRLFPIRADYVGLTLSTTLQEHINVEFDDENRITVYLQ